MEKTSPAPEELERRDSYRLEESLACDEHEAHCGGCGRHIADIEFLVDPECPNDDCGAKWQCVALRGDSPNHASHLPLPVESLDNIAIESYGINVERSYGRCLTLNDGVVQKQGPFSGDYIVDPLGRVK